MFENGRKTIGVFMALIYHEFQDILVKGICKQAVDLGYNVAFLTSFIGNGELEYEMGEINLGALPRYEDFDGIILLTDTLYSRGYDDLIRENIKKFCKCPVVNVRQNIEDYYNVVVDDYIILDDIINHFINVHGFTKINMLTGQKRNSAALDRRNTYIRILQEHNIPVEEERIYYGDFWNEMGYDAIDYWFSDPSRIPEAIVCANDYMAITVCKALMERGYRVPGDIAVSGCDNIRMAEDFSPSLTTVSMPVYDMGVEAVDKIHRHNLGITQEQSTYFNGTTYFRESCGCKKADADNNVKKLNSIAYELEDRDKAISTNANMSIDLTGVTQLELLDKKLSSSLKLIKGYSSFYMCLQQGWDTYDESNQCTCNEITKDIIMEFGFKNGERLPKIQFDRKDLLPPIYIDDSPQVFFFNILHHLEKCYGYTAISFSKPKAYKASYQGWLINVCNALENIKIHSELNRLVFRLEDMYVKDELTGLYNRRGLQTLGQKYLSRSVENQSRLMVFSADMDNLKRINDNFGHGGGDIAIKTVADALMAASEDDEICIRMGGDEFSVIGMEYDDTKMQHFIDNFESAIKNFNKNGMFGFIVKVSYGWSITLPDEDTRIEDCLSEADERMYQHKSEKEASRRKLTI
ncbi:MAG TPA: GGDEF domain-containing protein [Mobilitalea sp.]|nr:GGDEF domain-containing protein [Mobilitalea sp.]